jgi:hypothetical protein
MDPDTHFPIWDPSDDRLPKSFEGETSEEVVHVNFMNFLKLKDGVPIGGKIRPCVSVYERNYLFSDPVYLKNPQGPSFKPSIYYPDPKGGWLNATHLFPQYQMNSWYKLAVDPSIPTELIGSLPKSKPLSVFDYFLKELLEPISNRSKPFFPTDGGILNTLETRYHVSFNGSETIFQLMSHFDSETEPKSQKEMVESIKNYLATLSLQPIPYYDSEMGLKTQKDMDESIKRSLETLIFDLTQLAHFEKLGVNASHRQLVDSMTKKSEIIAKMPFGGILKLTLTIRNHL